MGGAKYLLATRSAHKAAEIRSLLHDCGAVILSLDEAGVIESAAEDDIEKFETFRENALAKARYFASLTGMTSIADDSGIMLDALGGSPGVRSRRFSGRTDLSGRDLDLANNELVAQQVARSRDRTAHYMCAAALAAPAGEACVTIGSCSGEFLLEPRGSGGFGYDPHFLLPAEGLTFGELSAQEKLQRSHRARAFRALVPLL